MSELDLRTEQLRNAVTLVLRLARCLPKEHKVRKQAIDYLERQNLMPSMLRGEPDHLALGGAAVDFRDYSPECVVACIRAVEAEAFFRTRKGLQAAYANYERFNAMDAAVALLPKEANDGRG